MARLSMNAKRGRKRRRAGFMGCGLKRRLDAFSQSALTMRSQRMSSRKERNLDGFIGNGEVGRDRIEGIKKGSIVGAGFAKGGVARLCGCT